MSNRTKHGAGDSIDVKNAGELASRIESAAAVEGGRVTASAERQDKPADMTRMHGLFVAITTDRYERGDRRPLPTVAESVLTVRDMLCSSELGERCFVEPFPELRENPSENDIWARLRSMTRDRVELSDTTLFMMVVGRSLEVGGEHFLLLRDSDPSDLASTAVRTTDLLEWEADSFANVVLVIDTEHTEALEASVHRLLRFGDSNRFVVLSHPDEPGRLTSSLAIAITGLTSPEGRRFGEAEYIAADELFDEVCDAMGETASPQLFRTARFHESPPCIPNPHVRSRDVVPTRGSRQALAVTVADLEVHWGPRSRGVASETDAGWLFSGRASLMRALIAAVAGPPKITIVSGRPGSGKSAALARLVTLSDETFLATHSDQALRVEPDLRPPIGAVDAAVVATGKHAGQLLAQICELLRVPPSSGTLGEATLDQRLLSWYSWLGSQSRPITIVIDAVDEASDPVTMVRDVLSRLEPGGSKKLRLLLGIRSTATSEESGVTLRESAGGAGLPEIRNYLTSGVQIVVDESPWWNQEDVVEYVESILVNTEGSPYVQDPDAARTVASSLGERSGRSFLIARIAATSLASRDEIVSASDSRWLSVLDDGVLGVFREDLRHSVEGYEDQRRAVVLLRAVAYAKGAGLPWRGVWPLVAHAVDDEGRHYGDTDISWLLSTRLAAYLVTDREDGTTVYRLFHDLLRTTLQDRWTDLLRSGSGPAPGPFSALRSPQGPAEHVR